MRFSEFKNINETFTDIKQATDMLGLLTNPFGSVLSGDAVSTAKDAGGQDTQSGKDADKDTRIVKKATSADVSTIQDPDFNKKLEKVASALGVRANDLLAVMKRESRVSPSAVNSTSKAIGLIQFMPKTAAALGTSTGALAKMTAVEQLDYVYKYYKMLGLKPGSDAGAIYMTTFYPAAAGKPDGHVISSKGNLIYDQNKVLDQNKDGQLTVGDVKASVTKFV